MKSIILKIVSPALSLAILISLFSWLFGKVNISPTPPKKIPIAIKKLEPPVKPAKPKTDARQKIKKAEKNYPKRSSIKAAVDVSKERFPVIRIYYASDSIVDYMRSLVSRNCLILVRSSAGKLLATYDPVKNVVSATIANDFSAYSPRTRIFALYAENPLTDRIIEKGVEVSHMISTPNGCSLISVLSFAWENAILNTIASAAHEAGIDPSDVSSVEAHFSSGRLLLTGIKTPTKTLKNINLPVNL
jgi:hypothetical protein